MAEFATANETPSSSQNSIEVEIVSDEEFEMWDEAIRMAINMEGKICSCCIKSNLCFVDLLRLKVHVQGPGPRMGIKWGRGGGVRWNCIKLK